MRVATFWGWEYQGLSVNCQCHNGITDSDLTIIQLVYRTAPCNLIVENIDGTFPTKPQSLEVRPVSSKAAWDKIQSNILVCTHLALIGEMEFVFACN